LIPCRLTDALAITNAAVEPVAVHGPASGRWPGRERSRSTKTVPSLKFRTSPAPGSSAILNDHGTPFPPSEGGSAFQPPPVIVPYVCAAPTRLVTAQPA